MRKIIFLDRDGVLNKEIGAYVTGPAELEVNRDVPQALKALQSKGYEFIIITNQGGIAKGLYTHQVLGNIHDKLLKQLSAEGIPILAIYYCPHHPDYTKCLCRKPGSLMLEKAIAKYKVDAALSYFIGDADRDIQAGASAGVNTVKVAPNQDLNTILQYIA